MKRPFLKFVFIAACSGLFLACNTLIGKSPDVDSADTKKSEIKFQDQPLDSNFHNGDIIFQTSNSGQSLAIQLATHSQYSHCGLLFNENGSWFVFEAVQPVKKTPIQEWIDRGDLKYYAVERLKNADSILTDSVLQKMRYSIHKNMGKNYDLAFNWSDDQIYCSELVWKAYKESTGLEIGILKKLGDFDLSNPIVKKQLNARYGNKIPLDEPMISPGDIFNSPLLIVVRATQ